MRRAWMIAYASAELVVGAFILTFPIFFPFWGALLGIIPCGITIILLLMNRGYRWLKFLPLLTITLWLIPASIAGYIFSLFAHGLFDSPSTLPTAETIINTIVGFLCVFPLALLIHLPVWKALSRPEIQARFADSGRMSSRSKVITAASISAALLISVVAATLLPAGPHGPRLIHPASEGGWLPIINLELRLGIPIEARNYSRVSATNDETPLILAATDFRTNAVNFLLDHGADINARDKYGNTALMTVCAGLFCEDEDRDLPNFIKEYAERIQMALLLIRRGADTTCMNSYKQNAYAIALNGLSGSSEDYELVDAFLARGANVNAKNRDDKTALDIAIEHLQFGNADKLITRGAKINPQTIFYAMNSPGTHADWSMLKYLIRRGVNVNVRDKTGKTPLFFADHFREYGVPPTRLLIQAGANINARDRFGRTALSYLDYKGYKGSEAAPYRNFLIANGAKL